MKSVKMSKIRQWLEHRRPEQEFLPPLMEIEHTPPSPLGRVVLWSSMVFLTIMLIWSILGEIDVVAVAEGKVVPSDRVKAIQSLETAVIKSILVKDGDYVKAGDDLLILDDGLTRPDVDSLTQQGLDLEARLLALTALLKGIDANGLDESSLDAVKDPLTHSKHLNLMNEQWSLYVSSMGELKNQTERFRQDMKTAQANIDRIKQTLPMINKRSEALKKLYAKQMVSEMEFLDVEERRIAMQQELIAERARWGSVSASMLQSLEAGDKLKAETRTRFAEEFNSLKTRLETTDYERDKANTRNELRVLKAPVSGYVQGLSVFTEGGVAKEAETLMNIVPEEGGVEVEAYISNKDIGFIKEGQRADVRIDAFDFTRFGSIDGVVISIADDATFDERKGLLFKAKVRLKRIGITVNMRRLNIAPGMSVSVGLPLERRSVLGILTGGVKEDVIRFGEI